MHSALGVYSSFTYERMAYVLMTMNLTHAHIMGLCFRIGKKLIMIGAALMGCCMRLDDETALNPDRTFISVPEMSPHARTATEEREWVSLPTDISGTEFLSSEQDEDDGYTV